MNGNEARRAAAEASILGAAHRAFVDLGYARTTMDGVASAARCSKRTLYRSFPTKEELFIAVVWHELDAVMHFPDTGSTRGDIEELTEELRRSAFALRPLSVGIVSEVDHSDALRAILQEESRRWLARVAEVFRRGIARGDLDAGLDVDLVTMLASSLFVYLAQHDLPFDGDLPHRLAQFLLAACK